jgi:hypothetical protein
MKFLNILMVTGLLTAISSSDAFAVPVKFPACATTTKIKEVPGGNGVVFNEACDQAYVLPPQSGSFSMMGLAATGNLELVCGQYNDIEAAMKSTTDTIKIYADRIDSLAKKAKVLQDQLDEGLIPVGETIDTVEQKIDDLMEKGAGYQDKYIKSMDSLRSLKEYYARTEGATGKFLMESKFANLVAAYQQANPHIHMERMPLEQSYLMINEKAPAQGDPVNIPMSAVLSISSPQADYLPLLQNIRAPKSGETPAPAPASPGGIFSDGLTGNIVLSAIGACPLMDRSGLPESIRIEDMENFVSANIVYQYHVQAQRKHHITYNLAQLAKRIESSSQKGGFFSRKSVHSLTEETESKKWITFETFENDPTFTYSEDYKKEIKQQFLDAVLKEVAYVSFDNPGAYPSLIEPTGSNGAQAAADGLSKCPHLYCQVGMYAMKFLDATFGGTSAVSNYIKTRNVWSEETVDEKQMVPYFGSYPLK